MSDNDPIDALKTPEILTVSQYEYGAGFQASRSARLQQDYPREGFVAALALLWGQHDADETQSFWRIQAEFHPARCEEILSSLESALHNPPEDFVDLIEVFGNMQLIRKEGSGFHEGEFTSDDYRAWLRDRIIELRAALPAKR